jgi:hypothetical protein
MDLAERWWNGQQGSDRRDIWLTATATGWHVRARHGQREVHRDLGREYEARALVDQLKATAPGEWRDITRLVRKPTTPQR